MVSEENELPHKTGSQVLPPALLPDSATKTRFSPLLRQLFATSPSVLCALSAGTIVGYSAILLPQLAEDQYFNFTTDEETWIASTAALPMAPSCILGGILMEVYGRKLINITVNIPFLAGWVLIYFSTGFPMFVCGRILQGIALGISGPLNSVFIGETTEPKYRGMLLGGVSLGYTLGILWSHLLGTFFRWKLTAIFCSSINVVTFLMFLMVPESPSYLLAKGNIESAYKAFGWLRGYGEEAVTEFNAMIANRKEKNSGRQFSSLLESFREPAFYKALLILLSLFGILQFVGVNAVAFYTVSIMKDTVGSGIDEYLAMILIDAVRFIVGIGSCIIIKKFHRRPLFIFSGLGTGISLILLSIFLYIPRDLIKINLSFIPLTFLVAYICFSTVGLLPLPWCLIGELFPLSSRGLGSGIASAANFLLFFIVVKCAPFMFAVAGMEGAFLIYGSIGIFGTIILYMFLPETMNKTLQEIENDLSSKKKPENKLPSP